MVRLRGRLDVNSAAAFLESFQKLPKLHTVLDTGELAYLSSAGLRVLNLASKSVPRLVVANFGRSCKEIYEVSGFAAIVAEHETVDDAVAALS